MPDTNSKQPEGVWVSIPLHLMAVSRYKVALNIRELTTLTNDFSKKYVGGCEPTLLKSYPKELSWHYKVTCKKDDSDPAGHEVRVKLDLAQVTSASKINDIQVRCSCTCPAFLYWGAQWHLHQQEALEGDARPKLQAPTQQLDKRNGYLVCKHVKVTSDRILPAVSRVVNDLARKLLVGENLKLQEQEVLDQEEDIRDKEERRTREQKKSPKRKSLVDLQGPDAGEKARRRKLIEEEEARLMEQEKALWEPVKPTRPKAVKPVKPKKTPYRSGVIN